MGPLKDGVSKIGGPPGTPIPVGFVPKLPHQEGLVVDLRGVDPEFRWEPSSESRLAYHIGKRTLDVVLSVVMMLVLSPVFLVLAVIVMASSPGPVFFHQKRVGRYGKPFVLSKFRTMVDGANESHHRHHYEQLANDNDDHRDLLIEEDPRVTRVGTFLRKWSLDELPNLWNVLKGDMSLVGPRPLVAYELLLYEPNQLRRVKVPPGITGLAQVNGRLQVTLGERADYDLEYVDHCSFWYDLGLLFRTIPAILTKRGA